MTITRAQHDHAVAVKLGIIHALKDNIGDDFSAHEIAEAMIDPPGLSSLNVSAILKAMVSEGLVAKRLAGNQNIYRLRKQALAWVPPPYDWRGEGQPAAKTKPPSAGKVNGTPVPIPLDKTPTRKQPKPPADKPAAKRTGAPIANLDASSQRKPADSHPWVHPPAVTKDKADRGAITRPLPVHLETPADLVAMALPEAPVPSFQELAAAAGPDAYQIANPPFEASCQPTVDDSGDSGQAILDDSSPSEIPNSSPTDVNPPEIPDSSPDQMNCSGLLVSSPDVVAHESPNNEQQTIPTESHEDEPPAHRGCGGHCANHAMASESEEAAHLQEAKKAFDWLDQKDLLIDQLTQELGDMEKRYHKLVDHLTDSQPPVTEQKEAVPIHLFNALQDQAASLLKERDALAADISNTKSALADALSDLAISRREQDRLHQQLREHDRQHAEDQNRIDALMDVARPHLAKGKYGETARAAAPFGLPVIPKDWIGLLKLTLLDDNAKLVLKIDSEGGGAYATLKVDAALNRGEADFIPGLTNGLIDLLDYLLPHLAISPPDHSADTGNMVQTSEARP